MDSNCYPEDGKGSAALEPMAAKRYLEELIEEGLRIEMFGFDRSTSIETVLKGINHHLRTNILHEFDCWHLIKNLMVKICEIKSLAPWYETIKTFYGFHLAKLKVHMTGSWNICW